MMTFTDLKNIFLDATQNTGSIDTSLLAFFQRQMDTKYQLILAELQNYTTQVQRTASTVAAQQFYHYPPGLVTIETATVTVGSIAYPLLTVNSQLNWDRLNELLISTTNIPQFIFPRRDDFGIWPIPQAVYTVTLNYNWRDRKLTNDDYSTGTTTVTQNSVTITGSGTTWTSKMIGRWFTTDTSAGGDGNWYRISNASTTSLTLETAYIGSTTASVTYRIGEVPELPDEAHMLLSIGAISDFFSLSRGDVAKGAAFNNYFWTGDINNSKREGEFHAGLLGLKQRYSTRSNTAIVKRKGSSGIYNSKVWGMSIT